MKKIYKLSWICALLLKSNLHAASTLEHTTLIGRTSPLLTFHEADQQDVVAKRFFKSIENRTATPKSLDEFLSHTWAKPFLEGDRFSNGHTLLTTAICCHTPLVFHLLARKANPNKPESPANPYLVERAPLAMAVERQNPSVVQALLEYGASLNAPTAFELFENALIQRDNLEAQNQIITLLLNKKPPLDQINKEGETVLHLGAKYSNLAIIESALKQNANLEVKDPRGKTPLLVAVQAHMMNLNEWLEFNKERAQKNLLIITLLLKHKAHVNAQDLEGKTALHYCKHYDHMNCARIDRSGLMLEAFKRLLAAGADWQIQDTDKKTFVDYRRSNRHEPQLLKAVELEKNARAGKIFV